MKLAANLNRSEELSWDAQYRGLDRTQKARTDERFTHYFVQNSGTMQAGQHPLHSRRKQSKVSISKQNNRMPSGAIGNQCQSMTWTLMLQQRSSPASCRHESVD